MGTERENRDSGAIQGIVTARKCGCCGHHEIGLTTDKGKFIPLKPGTPIRILMDNDASESPAQTP